MQPQLKMTNFIPALEEHIFGQKTAIHLLHNALQSSTFQSQLGERQKPLGCFLLVGKHGVGKRKIAETLAHHLFGTETCLHIAHHNNPSTWLDLYIREQNHYRPLSDAIQTKPDAIVLFENIDETFKNGVTFLEEIFSHADFRHAIIMVTTALGSEKLLTKQTTSQGVDLMQLVLNENIPFQNTRDLSHAHFHPDIFHDLKAFFPAGILRQLQLIPCLPLENTSLEKIIRTKLKSLRKITKTHLQLELQYAPEVITFLLQAVNKSLANHETIDAAIEHTLYPCIAHAVSSRMHHAQTSKQLFISLNDAGQLLKGEFIAASCEAYSL